MPMSTSFDLSAVTPVTVSAQGSGYAGNPQTTWGGGGGAGGGVGTSYGVGPPGTAGNMFNNITWTTTSSPTYTINTMPYVTQEAGKVNLDGEGADLVMNGVSLKDTLRAIEERLCILRPNPALEAQWDQLRELGEAYRKLEAELKEKQEMWDTLKKMPPPETK